MAILRAYEEGINFFDTSNAYGWGRSEELIGEALQGRRKEILLATKGGVITDLKDYERKDFSYKFLECSLLDSLRRLRTDYIDLYQLHSPAVSDITDEVMRFLEDLVKRGQARYVGVSISNEACAMRALTVPICRALQVYFNMIEQSLMDKVFPTARRGHVGLIGRVPLYSGLLSGRYSLGVEFPCYDHRSKWDRQLIVNVLEKVRSFESLVLETGRSLPQIALAFVLAHEEISVVIPGAKTPEQVLDNLSAMDVQLEVGKLTAIHKIYKEWHAASRN